MWMTLLSFIFPCSRAGERANQSIKQSIELLIDFDDNITQYEIVIACIGAGEMASQAVTTPEAGEWPGFEFRVYNS